MQTLPPIPAAPNGGGREYPRSRYESKRGPRRLGARRGRAHGLAGRAAAPTLVRPAGNLAASANLRPPGRNREAMNDDELIAAVATGDGSALRELFSRHAPWLAARLRAVLPAP